MKSHEPNYYYASCDVLIENLRDQEDKH
jgi:hypothetical protein